MSAYVETVVKELTHLGSRWKIVKFTKASGNFDFIARQGTSDTGPFSSVEQAEEFITQIRQT